MRIQSWLYSIDNWRLRRKLWKAAELLMYCGHENGSVQANINDAKDSIYAAISDVDKRRG